MNIIQNKVIEKKLIWGAELAHSALSRKKGGADRVFPAVIHCSSAGHAPRSVSVPMISQSGPATAEALRQLRSRGSHMDLVDGLEMGSPKFHLHSPDLALSQGGSLHCSSSPLRESTLICSSFLSRGNLYCFYSEWLACCRGNACITVICSSLYESFTSDRVYLSGCLTTFNFEKLILHFI